MALELPNGAKVVIDSNELIEKADADIKKYGGHKIVYAVVQEYQYQKYPGIEYISHYYSPHEAYLLDTLTPYYKKRIKYCTLTALRTKLEVQASCD